MQKNKILIPDYKETSLNSWKIKKGFSPPIVRGYFSGLQPSYNFENYILTKEEKVWMSLTPMELESMTPHIMSAIGRVVIAGLGMGVYLYNLINKEDVTDIAVIEKDHDLIEMIKDYGKKWGSDKVIIYEGDAFEVGEFKTEPDFLFIDIWSNLGTEKALEESIAITNNIKPKKIGYWGQELDFVDWLNKTKKPFPPTKEMFTEYKEEINLPLVWFKDYHLLAIEAAKNVILY